MAHKKVWYKVRGLKNTIHRVTEPSGRVESVHKRYHRDGKEEIVSVYRSC